MYLRYTFLAAALLLAAPAAFGQLLMDDRFNYPVGTLAGKGGWTIHADAGPSPVQLAGGSVAFVPAYPTDPNGSVVLSGGSGVREDVYKTFGTYSDSTLYASAVVSVREMATNDYFFFLAPNGTSTVWRGRVGIKAVTDGFVFTLSKGYAGANDEKLVAETTTRSFDRPYLFTLKYETRTGTNNDVVSLFVQSLTSNVGSEPRVPAITIPATFDASSDITPGVVVLRQGGASSRLSLDGLRVATVWPGSTVVAADDVEHPGDARLVVAGRTVRVAATGPLTVGLYDVLGRQVAALFNGEAAGNVSVPIPGDLPTGVYLVRAQGAAFSLARAVVLR